MNKLSALVISVFLLLAVAMWYLANASFEQYLTHEISVTGKAATGFEVTSENIAHSGDDLIIASVTLSDKQKRIIKLTDLHFKVDKKSYKEDVLVIEELTIAKLDMVNVDKHTKATLLANLLTYLTELQNNATEKNAQASTHKLPVMAIKQVYVGNPQQKQAIVLNSAIMEKGIEARALFVEIVKLLISQAQ
ncbi:hypothetical protein [Thalassotalea agariperforans]